VWGKSIIGASPSACCKRLPRLGDVSDTGRRLSGQPVQDTPSPDFLLEWYKLQRPARDDDDPRAPYEVYEGDELKGRYPTRARHGERNSDLKAKPLVQCRKRTFIIMDCLGNRYPIFQCLPVKRNGAQSDALNVKQERIGAGRRLCRDSANAVN
jgi:hypothetical protein